MSEPTRILFDFFNNMIFYMLLYRLAKENIHINVSKKFHYVMIALRILYSTPKNFPFESIIGTLFTFTCLVLMCHALNKQVIITYLKFQLLIVIGQLCIQIVHSLFTFDLLAIENNAYYSSCKSTLCLAMVYIFYVLYINGKRMRRIQPRLQNLFTGAIVSISLALSYLTLYMCQAVEMNTPTIPLLFIALYALIAVCIHIYQHLVNTLEENIHTRVLLEQNKMSQDYAKQIEHNLKELHSLRHDIRNHLITIDGYATRENYSAIHDYIAKITDNYTDIPLFDTPSNVVSALLNAKHQVAQQKNIEFSAELTFPYLHIEDFAIITILGNLVDNAITAASKCDKGKISLSMRQIESHLEINIKNNHIEKIKENNDVFESTQPEDGLLHGLGIKNIRSTVKQLNGHMDITYNDCIFNVNILIPNYEE